MKNPCRGCLLVLAGLAAALAPPCVDGRPGPQDKLTVPHVINVLGLEGVKNNAKGTLTVAGNSLQFAAGQTSAAVPVGSIEDVFTGADTARVVGGTIGMLSNFAPYEAGRFLSLFRKKIDALTIEYRDANGGLHGVILTMPEGQAAVVKKQLVVLGAKVSIPVEEEQKALQEKKKGTKEKKS